MTLAQQQTKKKKFYKRESYLGKVNNRPIDFSPLILKHEQLLEALYFIWDAFDRGPVEYFLIKDTAKQVKNNEKLSGTAINVGVRKMEWISGGKRVMDNFTAEYLVKETPELSEYKFNEVPINVYVYVDNDCITSLDAVVYENETFMLPNPYEKFVEKYE